VLLSVAVLSTFLIFSHLLPVLSLLSFSLSLSLTSFIWSSFTRSFRAVVSPALWFPTFIYCSHSPPLFLPSSVPSPRSLSLLLSLSSGADSLSRSGKRKPALAVTSCPIPESVAQAPASRALLASFSRSLILQYVARRLHGPNRGSQLDLNCSQQSVRHSAGIYQSPILENFWSFI